MGALKFFLIFFTCLTLAVAVAHPMGWAMIWLDEYEIDRSIR